MNVYLCIYHLGTKSNEHNEKSLNYKRLLVAVGYLSHQLLHSYFAFCAFCVFCALGTLGTL